MQITRNHPGQLPRLTLNQDSNKPEGTPPPLKPSAVDTVSAGVTKGANFANGTIGAWNGAVAGAIGGAAISLGGSAISTISGAISGTSQVTISSLLHTAGSAGLWAAGGAVAGGLVGCYAAKGLGKVVGGFGASVARKFGAPESTGRAVGTVATGLALGSLVGLGVAGHSGAAITLGAAALGGVVAYFKN
ncbi:MAG: hypothetical protein KF760_35370 [Candidatus Eremiobacteraeota bacterium]|nr:hypothetical protein [Candidatus Eremiobacteraeota bacterium]MCW5871134.1 hypothetical protein [Candidatus Eremiobacteraeota bacterium]